MTTIGDDDFIFYTDKEGDIYSGGFQVNSLLMKQGISPFVTLNQESQIGGQTHQVSDLFNHLVVPSWTLALPVTKGGTVSKKSEEEEEEIEREDIHNQLLSMILVNESEIKPKRKGTKKVRLVKSKGTRKIRKN
jgi:hypothetical protein